MNDQEMKIIESMIAEMRKPRLICICGNFKAGRPDIAFCFIKCKNCGGWMSYKRIKTQK
jgi:hypothetical protein